jgi:hypothetical protein
MDNAIKNLTRLGGTQFGIKAIYKNKNNRASVIGIFDSPHQGVNVAEVEFSSSTPIFTLPTKTLPCKPTIGDLMLFDDDTYTVRNFRADGTGMTTLQLEFATGYELATVNNLLLQDGYNMLLEDNGYVLLEVSN